MAEDAEKKAAEQVQTAPKPTPKSNQPETSPDKSMEALGKIPHIWVFIFVIAILFILGVAGSLTKSVLLLGVVVGCVGGIIHDLVQNKAIILYPKTSDEGVYIGWILGVILGGAAGFIAIASGVASTAFNAQSLLAPFTAGIALKGITDAAANASAKDVPEVKPTANASAPPVPGVNPNPANS